METEDDVAFFERAMNERHAPAGDQGNAHAAEPPPEPVENEPPAQPRDESGRFALEALKEPSAEPPAVDAQQQPQLAADQRAEPAVPPHRLREEADGRRAAEERAVRLEAEVNQMRQMMAQMMRPQPQPTPQPQEPPDMYTDGDAWHHYRTQQELAPIVQQMDAYQQRLVNMDRAIASAEFGREAVETAEKAFNDLHARGALDPADLHKIANAENRFSAAVQWHKRSSLLSEIGNDPAAYRERIKAEILAEMNAGQASQAQAQPPANVVKIPASLNRATSAAPANQAGGSEQMLSDEELFNKVTSRRR